MPDMMTRLAKGPGGVAGVVMQPVYDHPEVERSVELAEQAVARLASRRLEAGEAIELATGLRMMKHANPVLGVISAYLYEAIGDQASIRRMAYFYVVHGQAIPYDIAFLADLAPDTRGNGDPRAVVVPALQARDARTPAEQLAEWTRCETEEVRGLVAGRMPWIRRGWPFLAGIKTPPEDALAHGLSVSMQREVAASTFTSFSCRGGYELIELLHLEEVS